MVLNGGGSEWQAEPVGGSVCVGWGWYSFKLLFKFSTPEQIVRKVMPNFKLMISF